MPLFTLSKTSVDIDYNPEQRKNLKSSILSLIETDTVCYRENPQNRLGKLQKSKLNPVIKYVNNKY